MFYRRIKLTYILDALGVSRETSHFHFWVNYPFNPKCICYKDSPQGVTRGWICLFKSRVTIVVVLFIIKKWNQWVGMQKSPATESNRLMKRIKIQQKREKTTSLDTELKTLNTQDQQSRVFLAAGWSWSAHCQTNMIITSNGPFTIPDCFGSLNVISIWSRLLCFLWNSSPCPWGLAV